MRRINPERLTLGSRFRGALLDSAGRRLLRPGEPLTAAMIDFLRSGNGAMIALSEEAPPPPAQLHALAERREGLRRRWAIRAGLRRSAEALVAARRPRWSRLDLRIPAAPASNALLEERFEPAPIAHERAERTGVLRRVLSRLAHGDAADPGALDELVYELVDLCHRSGPMLANTFLGGEEEGISPRADSLAEHGYTTAAFAVGIAQRLGWSFEHTRSAGLAGLLADSGMALLPLPIRTQMRPLTEIELNSLRRHTAYSALLVQHLASAGHGIPEEVQLAVYQHHERGDGSGYPEGLRADRIHDLAKVVAVADAFAGATEPRAHRPGLPPQTALSDLARQAAAGAFDKRVVRALVSLCGIMPAIRTSATPNALLAA